MERDIHPPIKREKTNQNFTSIAIVDKKDGKIYVENTGNSPIRSVENCIDIFIHAILSAPIKDTKSETMIKAFQTHTKYTTKRGSKPSFNIIDNVVSKAIKVYLQEENIQMKLVEPHNHQVIVVYRAIHTLIIISLME